MMTYDPVRASDELRGTTRLFDAIPNAPDSAFPMSAYPSHGAIEKILDTLPVILGIGPTRISRLLGCYNYATYSRWVNGQRRPSPLMESRMIYLLILHIQEMQVSEMREIDYYTGEIRWRRGFDPNKKPIP